MTPAAATVGDERTLLGVFLDRQRAAFLRNVEGLDDDQLRWSPVGSGTSLLGLLSHVTHVEAWWFRAVLDGQDVPSPWSEDDPGAEWRVPHGTDPAEVVAAYRAEIARCRAVVSRHEMSELIAFEGRRFSVRWIVLHMIEETARHNGHADIIRELIDGTTGE